MSTHTEEFWKR